MTVDDFLAQLMSLPRFYTQAEKGLADKKLKCWLLARTDPGFLQEIYERHELDRRPVRPALSPKDSADDELLMIDAWSYLNALYDAHNDAREIAKSLTERTSEGRIR